ncbi:hypothetical protein ACWGF3_31935 [Streptomyces xanthophaeus]|uniref:SHOCT domain-containing protein n=1 Tax=Streptomyces xanthophaeus TaxID=67385 RepID=A0A919LB53_9ACTN|nr:hypothetical protein [Streptomyces xanthophaeus]GHI87408.1 hypothetical protein Sxan_47720 [Streptomyces xanthophaeus]
MFIRPVGPTVHPASRPPGHPLLRGLLARAAGAAEAPDASGGAGGAGGADAPHAVDTAYAADAADAPGSLAPEPRPATARPKQPQPHPTPAPQGGLAAELAQLAALAHEGHLTPEEFTTAKARLLGGG